MSTSSNSGNSTSLYGEAGTPIPDSSGNVIVRGDLYVLSGNILTTATTGNIFPANATTINLGLAATAMNIGAATGTTTINNALTAGGTVTAPGADFGNITIAVADDNTITTTSGNLILTSATGALQLAQGADIVYSENNSRFNRPTVQSTSGNTSGLRVAAPNTGSSAQGLFSVINSSDNLNAEFLQMGARGSALLNTFRFFTGEYIAGVLGPTNKSIAFVDDTNLYATINPAGPTIGTDLTTKTYVDAAVAGGVTSITGTANQVIASSPTGAVTLSLPQDIDTTSGVTFNTVTADLVFTDEVRAKTDNIVVTTQPGNKANLGLYENVSSPDGLAIITVNSNGWYFVDDGRTQFPNYTFPAADGAVNEVLTTDGSGNVSWALPGGGGSTFGNITVAVVDDNTISTTSGNLILTSATGDLELAQATIIKYDESNNRANRPSVQSTTGNSSGFRVIAPNATTSAGSNMTVFGSNDIDNGEFLNLRATGSTTAPFSIRTGKYTAGVLGASNEEINFIDNVTTYASVNPAGPTNSTDLTTKAYVDALTVGVSSVTGGTHVSASPTTGAVVVTTDATDANTASTIVARDASGNFSAGLGTFTSVATPLIQGGGVPLVITGGAIAPSALTLDDYQTTLALDGGVGYGNSTLTTTYNSLTWAHTAGGLDPGSVNGTWAWNADGTTDFPNYTFPYADGTANQVLQTDGTGNLNWYSPADLNTTYDFNATSSIGGANLNLVGSDATTDTVKLTDGGHITATYTSGTVVTLGSDATNANTASTIVARDASGDFSAGTITANLAGGSRVLGALEATTSTAYTFLPPNLTTTNNNNGLDVASSMPAGTDGNGAQQQLAHYFGDVRSGTNTAPVLVMRSANGNSVTGGTVPWSGVAQVAPSALAVNNILGSINFNGYATTDFGDVIATDNQGGGFNGNSALQIQSVAAETFVDGTLTISGATITAVSRVNVAQTVTSVSGTRGQLTIPSTLVGVGTAVVVTGTNIGTSTGISAGNYYVVANNGGSGNSTQITLGATPGGAPITTTAGTTTGLTFTRQLITVTYSAQSNIPFGLNALITVANITNVTGGTYMAIATSTTTSVTIGALSSGAVSLPGTQSLSLPTVTAMGAGLRVRAMPLATTANSGNRVELVNHNTTTAKYRSDTFVIASAAYGTTGVDRLTVDSAKITAALPIQFPSYTAVAANAITGAVGQQIAITNSPTVGGRMAFWDTTNARWSYISDNTAV